MYQYDTTTFELTESRLQLKSNLRFSIQRSRHGDWYLIEDESRGTFFRIGPAEYTFISLLDGETTMATAMARTCSTMGASALNEQEAVQLCKWLIESGLASTDASVSANRIGEQQEDLAKQQRIQKLNPISIRVPLFNPSTLVNHLTRLFGGLFCWPMMIIWLMVCSYATVRFAMDWQRFFQNSVQVFTRDGFLWMGATWLLLKLVHELAHAVACRKLGGTTGDCGILFLLMIPLPFVDVTSSWRFSNKYHRMLVSAAGMLAEIFIAAIATIVWCNSGPGVVSFYASSIMVAASLHTLLFNANPLLKFDGYHILADWLEIPNLASHGHRFVMGCFRKWFFALSSEEVKYAGLHGYLIRGYGFAALVWRILLCFVLGLAAANLLQGVGLAMAIFAAVLWVALPIKKFVNYLIKGGDYEQPDRIHFSKVVSAIGVLSLAAMLGLPAPSVITAPLVVEYEDLSIVRNESAGFVRQVSVKRDQWVEQGDVLLVLENHDLSVKRISTALELQAATLRANEKKAAGDISALQIELESVESFQKQLVELTDAESKLQVRAPQAGKVIAVDLLRLKNSYVNAGTELLSIADDNKKQAVVMIAQDDASHLANLQGASADVRIWGLGGIRSGTIADIHPGGQVSLPHFSFAGMFGGPLDVANRSQMMRTDEREQQTGSQAKPDDDLMLIEARVKAEITFDTETSQRLHAGQTGLAHLRGRSGNLGGYLVNVVRRWFNDRVTLGHGI